MHNSLWTPDFWHVCDVNLPFVDQTYDSKTETMVNICLGYFQPRVGHSNFRVISTFSQHSRWNFRRMSSNGSFIYYVSIFLDSFWPTHYVSINTVLNDSKNGHFLNPPTQSICWRNVWIINLMAPLPHNRGPKHGQSYWQKSSWFEPGIIQISFFLQNLK